MRDGPTPQMINVVVDFLYETAVTVLALAALPAATSPDTKLWDLVLWNFLMQTVFTRKPGAIMELSSLTIQPRRTLNLKMS